MRCIDCPAMPVCNAIKGSSLCDTVCQQLSKAEKDPRVILFIEGGIIHDVMADAPVKIRIIDYDTEGSDRAKFIKLPGSEKGEVERVHISKYDMAGIEDVEPFFKQKEIR